MNEEAFLKRPVSRAHELKGRAERFSAFEPATRLAFRLEDAIEAGSGETVDRPVLICLTGSTGCGKSALFNALVGREEASPTAVTRGHTKAPFAAGNSRDFSLLGGLRKIDARHVPADFDGIVIVDTPDLDSVERENRDLARRVIEMADVVVYVTIPDRISDFAIHEEIREWSRKKRWFFVLNKTDTYPDALPEIRDGFDERLRQLGFTVDDRVRFLVSAKAPDKFEFSLFHRAVFSSRAVERVRALRVDGVLGLLQHAVDEAEMLRPWREKGERLRLREQELDGKLRGLYRSALESDSAREAVRLLVRNRTWQNLSIRTGWIMGGVVWIKCRAAMMSSAWHLGRMLTRGPTVFGLVWIGLVSVMSAVRGMLPLRNLRNALSGELERELKETERDAQRTLEDENVFVEDLAKSSEVGEAGGDDARDAWLATIRAVPAVGKEAARAVEATARERSLADDLTGPLLAAIEESADRAARRSVGPIVKFLANLLPTLVLGHVAWRVGQAWYLAEWLPAGFYGLALLVFLFSLIPGFLLLSISVRARTRAPTVEAVVAGITRPAATAPIRAVREELEAVLHRADSLSRMVNAMRETLSSELPVETFGARSSNHDNREVETGRIPDNR